MTPQQKAMADLMHVSLFKLADAYHATIARVRQNCSPEGRAALDQLSLDVEKMVDDTIQDFSDKGGDMSMQAIDRIHKAIVEAKSLARD